MTMFRRMDGKVAYINLIFNGWDVFIPNEAYICVGQGKRCIRALRVPFSGCIETITHVETSIPVRELLCAAIREGLLRLGYDSKKLVKACIRDKIESNRAEWLSKGALLGAVMVCEGKAKETFHLTRYIKEIVYHDPV